jgi:hypothetical protein
MKKLDKILKKLAWKGNHQDNQETNDIDLTTNNLSNPEIIVSMQDNVEDQSSNSDILPIGEDYDSENSPKPVKSENRVSQLLDSLPPSPVFTKKGDIFSGSTEIIGQFVDPDFYASVTQTAGDFDFS